MDRSALPPAVVMHGVSWAGYLAIERARGRDNGPRMAYLDGELEIMTTGFDHEWRKKLLARLVETFAEEREIELSGFGSTTFRKRAKQVGAEPDECYYVGRFRRAAPDLAFEVVWTSGGVDKLEIYRRLGAREVWSWIDGKIELYRLVGARYQRWRRSALLPGLDLEDLARRVSAAAWNRQTSAVRAFRRALQRQR